MLVLDVSRRIRGVGPQEEFDHLAPEDHWMPVLLSELRNHRPDRFRLCLQKLFLQSCQRVDARGGPVNQSDACCVAAAIKNGLQSQPQRAELAPLRIRIYY